MLIGSAIHGEGVEVRFLGGLLVWTEAQKHTREKLECIVPLFSVL